MKKANQAQLSSAQIDSFMQEFADLMNDLHQALRPYTLQLQELQPQFLKELQREGKLSSELTLEQLTSEHKELLALKYNQHCDTIDPHLRVAFWSLQRFMEICQLEHKLHEQLVRLRAKSKSFQRKGRFTAEEEVSFRLKLKEQRQQSVLLLMQLQANMQDILFGTKIVALKAVAQAYLDHHADLVNLFANGESLVVLDSASA